VACGLLEPRTGVRVGLMENDLRAGSFYLSQPSKLCQLGPNGEGIGPTKISQEKKDPKENRMNIGRAQTLHILEDTSGPERDCCKYPGNSCQVSCVTTHLTPLLQCGRGTDLLSLLQMSKLRLSRAGRFAHASAGLYGLPYRYRSSSGFP
jgi:hypothetical protein